MKKYILETGCMMRDLTADCSPSQHARPITTAAALVAFCMTCLPNTPVAGDVT